MLNRNEPYKSVSYLFGNAGVGKSFIKTPLKNIFPPKANTCTVNLEKKIRPGKVYGSLIKQTPQLSSSEVVLGTLPEIMEPGSFSFDCMLEDSKCSLISNNNHSEVIIIDDLDEIHPNSSKFILESVDDYVEEAQKFNEKKSINFIILGRPEAFSKWLSDSHHKNPINFKKFCINGPQYTHKKDIDLMVLSYFMFRERKMPPKQLFNKVAEIIFSNNYLYHTTANNLSNANFTIKRLHENQSYSENQLKNKLFTDFIGRNNSSHNRPAMTGEKGELQLRLFQNIATKFINKIDKNGYFEVDISDIVNVVTNNIDKQIDVLNISPTCDVQTIAFNIQQTLEYSGIVEIEPVSEKAKKYKFSPFWIHRFLVEKRSLR